MAPAPILVTGATGTLGRLVVDRLVDAGREVRAMSRRPRPVADRGAYEWAQSDLRRGTGIEDAVAGAPTVVHCATGPGDVKAARNLIEASRGAGVTHLVYISIVGVDRVPLPYYRWKLEVEQQLSRSGLEVTVLRATQFHDLIVRGCRALARLPVLVVPAGTSFQPVEAAEVADRLVELSLGSPAGRVPDMGGPEALPAAELARAYLGSVGRRRPLMAVRFPGRVAAGYRKGGHLAPGQAVGRVTFQEFLARTGVGGASPVR